MTHHTLPMPITEAQVRALRVGDTVTLEETLYGIRDATQIHMFDHGRRTKFNLQGHAVIHTAPNLRKVERVGNNHSGYEAVCVGTTTSDRMERFTRPLMEREGAPIWPWSAARPHWRLPGSKRWRMWIWMISILRASTNFASRASGLCWWRWIAMAAAFMPQ